MKWLLVSLLLVGCFPYRELYRPDLHGRLVDETGAAVAGAEVKSCSYPRWSPPKADCPRSATSTTDADGGFHFSALREWEWCCFGEAPMPMTELFTCVDGGAAYTGEAHGWPKDEVQLRLGDGSTRCVE